MYYSIGKKGVIYTFHQRIIRLSDDKLCAKAQIDVVNLVDGVLSQPDIFDEAFKEYI